MSAIARIPSKTQTQIGVLLSLSDEDVVVEAGTSTRRVDVSCTVVVKTVSEVSPRELERENPEWRTHEELTALMGNYAQTAFFLNAFEVQLPEQRTEPVLPV